MRDDDIKMGSERHSPMGAPIKTSVSIQKTLVDQIEILAQQLNISPTYLFEMAFENFINNAQYQPLFEEAAKVSAIAKTDEDQPNPNQKIKSSSQDTKLIPHTRLESSAVNQGDIYWIQLEEPNGSELGYYPHPYVVIQDNLFNHSRISTLIVCALTSNIKQANELGNVLLNVGEASLPKHSAVIVSKISVVDKTQLGDYIGSLTKQRIDQILAGIRFQQRSFFRR